MPRIELRALLQQTVADHYGDLVTRPTGQAVRRAIETLLAQNGDDGIAALDFGTVRCLDLSCADEIVGRLVREHADSRWFVLLNVTDAHRDALDFVLRRYQLAVVARDPAGRLDLVGTVPEPARQAFGALAQLGRARPEEIAQRTGLALEAAARALDELARRRLILVEAGQFAAPPIG